MALLPSADANVGHSHTHHALHPFPFTNVALTFRVMATMQLLVLWIVLDDYFTPLQLTGKFKLAITCK